MSEYLVSDLHIDDGKRGGFNKNREAFHSFLDMVGKDNRLILNGDSLELWACNIWEILSGPNEATVKRLQEMDDLLVIPGNHDIEEGLLHRLFPKAEITYLRQIGDYKIFHGYQVDLLLDDPHERWLASNLDRMFTILDVCALNHLRAKLADIDRKNDHLIERLQGKGNFIVGHSHIPEDLGWFVNPGSWIRNRLTYVEIQDEKPTLKEFQAK